MLAALSASMLIFVFPQTLQVGLALESPLRVTLKELKTNSDRYVNKVVEVTGKIVDKAICPHDSDHYLYRFSDDTDYVDFLWFPELLSGRYEAVGNLTYYSGPLPPFGLCEDWVKGVAWWVTSEGYYWWRIELTPLPEITPVGGYEVLIDKTKFTPSPWTSPLIALVSLTILATATSVIHVRHRKKQRT